MCCDICPYYDECQELDKLQEGCCGECPDYEECVGTNYDHNSEEETEEF